MIDSLLNASFVEKLAHYSTLYVGFSGGIDSTVLLYELAAFPSLKDRLHAVHVNHGLSSNALEWENHCLVVCCDLGVKFSAYRIQLLATSNIEESARIARHEVFHSLMKSNDALILAHHQDDQAETLLLNLVRGAGIDGLSAMLDVQSMLQGDVIRPLLSTSRIAIEAYAQVHALKWVEDESNQHEHFSRNYIRHRIMPLLKQQWPSAAKSIARSAAHCQQAKKNLEALAEIDGVTKNNRLSIGAIKSLPRERLLNVLRIWIQYNGYQCPSEKTLFRIIDELMFARQDAEPKVTFGEVVVRRYKDDIYCLRQSASNNETLLWLDYPYPLSIDGAGAILHVEPSVQGALIPEGSQIEVRFRKGGESFRWHGQTKSLKKLMQYWQIPSWMRDEIPLIYVNDVLAVIVGYAVSDDFYSREKASSIILKQT